LGALIGESEELVRIVSKIVVSTKRNQERGEFKVQSSKVDLSCSILNF
jgi:hypothetical protein